MRGSTARPRPEYRRYPGFCEEKPHRAACQGQEDAFGEELSHQAAAPGTQRAAHGELALARTGTGEEQVRGVHAPDHEDYTRHRQ